MQNGGRPYCWIVRQHCNTHNISWNMNAPQLKFDVLLNIEAHEKHESRLDLICKRSSHFAVKSWLQSTIQILYKTSQELRTLSRSLSDCQSLTLNFMILFNLSGIVNCDTKSLSLSLSLSLFFCLFLYLKTYTVARKWLLMVNKMRYQIVKQR